MFHCYQSAVTGNFWDELTKLLEQTILGGAISLLSEGAQAQSGRVQMHFGGADRKHPDDKIWTKPTDFYFIHSFQKLLHFVFGKSSSVVVIVLQSTRVIHDSTEIQAASTCPGTVTIFTGQSLRNVCSPLTASHAHVFVVKGMKIWRLF